MTYNQNITLETIQWATLPNINDVAPIDDKDHEVLQEVRDVLQRHGYTKRFGICLLHRHFDLKEDECLMEYTDDESRSQMLVVEKKATTSSAVLETMWRFSDMTQVTKCEKACVYNRGHKQVHQKVGR